MEQIRAFPGTLNCVNILSNERFRNFFSNLYSIIVVNKLSCFDVALNLKYGDEKEDRRCLELEAGSRGRLLA